MIQYYSPFDFERDLMTQTRELVDQSRLLIEQSRRLVDSQHVNRTMGGLVVRQLPADRKAA